MSLRTKLLDFAEVVSEEAQRNPDFAQRLQRIFDTKSNRSKTRLSPARQKLSRSSRPANRRPPAILDPVALAVQGEDALRKELDPLTLDQLKDIIADYGMDHDRLAMKWKTQWRLIDRIVEVSIGRAHKGDAFRS